MEIVYSQHLLEEIAFRGIRKGFVEACVKKPDVVLPAKDKRRAFLKDMGINYLKVIVVEDMGKLVVITAYWFAKKRLKS